MGRPRILLTEDDSTARAVLTEALTDEGYDVCAAHDGQDALDQLVHFTPHLVLTDLLMPRVDGFQLLQRVTQRVPGVPVVVLTVSTNQQADQQARRLGAMEVLHKPLSLDGLLALVAAVLGPRLA